MAPRTLKEPLHTLEAQIIETMLAGTAGYEYPKSVSDMRYCVRNLLRMFDVKRLPLARDLPYADAAEQAGAADVPSYVCQECGASVTDHQQSCSHYYPERG